MSQPNHAPASVITATTRTCRNCGKSLEGKKVTALHCNDKCRMGYNVRKREAGEIRARYMDQIKFHEHHAAYQRERMEAELRERNLTDF